jgi:hypothetical protein
METDCEKVIEMFDLPSTYCEYCHDRLNEYEDYEDWKKTPNDVGKELVLVNGKRVVVCCNVARDYEDYAVSNMG